MSRHRPSQHHRLTRHELARKLNASMVTVMPTYLIDMVDRHDGRRVREPSKRCCADAVRHMRVFRSKNTASPGLNRDLMNAYGWRRESPSVASLNPLRQLLELEVSDAIVLRKGSSATPATRVPHRWCSLVVLLDFFIGCEAVHAQPATFRTDAELVPIYATVVGDDDRLVTDLTRDDSQVLDNGKAQTLALFESTYQPVTVVVMLDTSASMTRALDRLAEGAEQFVIRLLPQDRARLCVFNDRIQFSPTFSADRDALIDDIRQIDYGNQTRLYDGVAASLDALRPIVGRKVIVIFSDGDDTASKSRLRAVISRARAENVMVYAIGFASKHVNRDGDEIRTQPDPGLAQLAAGTGGGYFELTRFRDLSSTFTRVSKELHNQYVLAITPTGFDGRVHKLVVHVTNTHLNVRARRSYLAPRAPGRNPR